MGETMTLRDAIPSSRMDFTTLGMIMQTIGLYFDHQTKKQMTELKSRLERLGLDTMDLDYSSPASPTSPCSPLSPKNKMIAALGDDGFDEQSDCGSMASGVSVATVENLMSMVMTEQSKFGEVGAENNKLKEQIRAHKEEIAKLKAAENSAEQRE